MKVELETQIEIPAYPNCIACEMVAEHDHQKVTYMHA
jgi:hypothetical protein